jgi:hypothetical protein
MAIPTSGPGTSGTMANKTPDTKPSSTQSGTRKKSISRRDHDESHKCSRNLSGLFDAQEEDRDMAYTKDADLDVCECGTHTDLYRKHDGVFTPVCGECMHTK